MLPLLRLRLREVALHLAPLLARRKIAVIEALGLPEDLERAAVRKVERVMEERVDAFTRLE